MLCKKPQPVKKLEDNDVIVNIKESVTHKGTGTWKTWLNKSLNLKISSH